MLVQRTSTPYYATSTIKVWCGTRPTQYHRWGSPTVVMMMQNVLAQLLNKDIIMWLCTCGQINGCGQHKAL